MSSDTNLNSIISQGIAIKEIYNPKKQNLELQQHFSAQHTEIKKKKDKSKVRKLAVDNLIEDREDKGEMKKKHKKNRKQKEYGERKEDQRIEPEGNLIDIKV
jgi:hypothetical protein